MSTTNQSNIVPKKLLATGASGLLGAPAQAFSYVREMQLA